MTDRSKNAADTRCRLYLISPPQIPDPAAFLEAVSRAIDGGDIACLQLRLKVDDVPAPEDDILHLAEALLPRLQAHDIALLINDRPDLAKKAGADGVHIGQGDASYTDARAQLGEDAIVGVTCHDSRHLALEAGEAGADYVAFGAFFPTKTKDASTTAPISLLEWWSFATIVPSVAIGGVTPENAMPLVAAGADFLAVSGAVWLADEGPAAAVAAFNQLFDTAVRQA